MADPAEIQRQIEQTRAELASTVDAIADRVSPKRVAARSVDSVKAKVEDLRSRGTAQPTPLPGEVRALPAGAATGQQPLPARISAQLREARQTGGKSVRWDRVGLVAGAVALLALVRKRRAASRSGLDKAVDKAVVKARKSAKEARKSAGKAKKKAAKKAKK